MATEPAATTIMDAGGGGTGTLVSAPQRSADQDPDSTVALVANLPNDLPPGIATKDKPPSAGTTAGTAASSATSIVSSGRSSGSGGTTASSAETPPMPSAMPVPAPGAAAASAAVVTHGAAVHGYGQSHGGGGVTTTHAPQAGMAMDGSAHPAQDEEPQFVGHYRIIRFIAQGSYGRVRLAQDMRTNRTVSNARAPLQGVPCA